MDPDPDAHTPLPSAPPAPARAPALRDAGAAVAEFVLVAGVLTWAFAGVLQLALTVHVRNVLVDCARTGARQGALAGAGADAARTRAQEVVSAELGAGYQVQITQAEVEVAGVPTVEVRIQAPVPVLGLVGAGQLTVYGHAMVEPP